MGQRLLVVVAVAACGRGAGAPPAPPEHRDAAAGHDAVTIELAPRPLGMAEVDGFGWRKRAGQAPFRAARKAEDRDDWPHVVEACHEALAADPGHLEAAWLLAVALAKVGRLDEIVPPLAIAVAGDYGKWATASLEQPALQPFLATPAGQAWRRRVEADRPTYLAALARSIVMTSRGDLYAFDPEPGRWYRLTRTWGGVIGAFAAPTGHRLAYVTRRGKSAKILGIGLVDLATGHTTKPTELGPAGSTDLAYATGKPGGFWVGGAAGVHLIDDDGKLVATKLHRPAGAWLQIATPGPVRLHRPPVTNVAADWDDDDLASAIKIGTSNRVVAVPGLVDGRTATWSPDRAHLAFVALLDDRCAPAIAAPGAKTAARAVAFVAEAATGTVVELERASGGIAVEWLADRKLALAGDHGVSIVELGGASVPLTGADGLVTPRRKPRCSVEPTDELPPPEDEPVDPGEEPTDAGTR